MNALRMQIMKHQASFFRFYYDILNIHRLLPISYFATTVDVIDASIGDNMTQQKKCNNSNLNVLWFSLNHFNETNSKPNEIISLPEDEFEKTVQNVLYKNKDKQIEQILKQCVSIHRLISDQLLKTMLKHYSNTGKPEMIVIIQKYFLRLLPNSYRRNGEFAHYIAKAQCLKGNSSIGLSILRESYKKNENLRSFYRVLLRELIHDAVMNRSEASLVVFKKHVLEYSQEWQEHYPLVCFWHICWLSSWYSDQMLSNELWESSETLQNIVKGKVSALCISALKSESNEDAVIRLLQLLLKYKMIQEYSSVLRVLFNYKLRNRDIRGCAEIVRNSEVLGISLPSEQQGKYIKMLINETPDKPTVKPTKDFKLKF